MVCFFITRLRKSFFKKMNSFCRRFSVFVIKKLHVHERKLSKSLVCREKSVILQPKSNKNKENEINSIYKLVVAQLKILTVVSYEAM